MVPLADDVSPNRGRGCAALANAAASRVLRVKTEAPFSSCASGFIRKASREGTSFPFQMVAHPHGQGSIATRSRAASLSLSAAVTAWAPMRLRRDARKASDLAPLQDLFEDREIGRAHV